MTHYKQPSGKQLGTTKVQPERMTKFKEEKEVGEIRSMWHHHRLTIEWIMRLTGRPREYIYDVVYYRIHPTIEMRAEYTPTGFQLPRERRI